MKRQMKTNIDPAGEHDQIRAGLLGKIDWDEAPDEDQY